MYWKLFRKPSLLQTATNELADAERERLLAQTAVEFYQSTVAYNDARIKRLKAYITTLAKPQKPEITPKTLGMGTDSQ
jgi:hypothetical protein